MWLLRNRYFSNKIEVNPTTVFGATYIGEEVSKYIKFKNYYTTNYSLTFNNLHSPYNINRSNITFLPDQTDSLLIKFVLPDTTQFLYRDSLVKKCLKEWNLTMQGNAVPVSPDNIDKLPGNIVSELYRKFEKIITYTEDELGN